MSLPELTWHTEQRDPLDLIPFEFNPRRLNAKQRQELIHSLEKFDLVEIPAIDTDNILVAGHQRVAILIALGQTQKIDVRVPNRKLTKDEFKEYNIRSNKTTASWDFQKLKAFFGMDELIRWGFELRDMSFRDMIIKKPEREKVHVPDMIIRHQIKFVTAEQQEQWLAFLKKLIKTVPGNSISARLIQYVSYDKKN